MSVYFRVGFFTQQSEGAPHPRFSLSKSFREPLNKSAAAKDPLTTVADLFRGSQDSSSAYRLLGMAQRTFSTCKQLPMKASSGAVSVFRKSLVHVILSAGEESHAGTSAYTGDSSAALLPQNDMREIACTRLPCRCAPRNDTLGLPLDFVNLR